MNDKRDAVQAQYEEWVYPLPHADLAEAVSSGWFDLGDPRFLRRKLWPRRVEPASLEILVAGCGSNQAALYAFTNPDCHVVGIDISEASLEHEARLKRQHRLDNLELHHLPLERVDDLRQSFDCICSSGVLHHLADPDEGLRSLRGALLPHGVITVMLYGTHGRAGVYMIQEVLRLFGTEQDADGLEMVRHVLATIPEWHAVKRYLTNSPDVLFDAGLVDSFLHKVDRSYTVAEVLQFAHDNGVKFQAWLDNLFYSPSARIAAGDDMLLQGAQSLDKAEQWKLVDLLWPLATHRFVLCHVDRPEADYTIDFSGDAWLDYVPSLRPPIEIKLSQVQNSHAIDDSASPAVSVGRGFHTVELDPFGVAALDLVNGATPIRAILDETSKIENHVEAGRRFFRQMAEWDHLLFEIP